MHLQSYIILVPWLNRRTAFYVESVMFLIQLEGLLSSDMCCLASQADCGLWFLVCCEPSLFPGKRDWFVNWISELISRECCQAGVSQLLLQENRIQFLVVCCLPQLWKEISAADGGESEPLELSMEPYSHFTLRQEQEAH